MIKIKDKNQILFSLAWLLFPVAIALLIIKREELKYREKAQLISSIIIGGLITGITILFKFLGLYVFASIDILSIFFIIPLGMIWIIGTIKAIKADYLRCPIIYNLACKFLKNTEKDDEDVEFDSKSLNLSEGTKSIVSSIVSILIGVLCGFIIMVIISFISPEIKSTNIFKALKDLLSGPFASKLTKNKISNTGNMIFYAVPLIFTGLSVAVAFKTGLFNIGAPGQYIMGTIGCLLVALSIQSSSRFAGVLVWILAVIVGMLCGMLWGMIPGFLKAYFGVNEVIACIMTNWIAANICSWVFTGFPDLFSKENTKTAYLIKTAVTGNYTPKLGLDKLFPGSLIDIGIIIAVIIAVVILIMLNRTTIGYELKACGGNKNASRYAGLNEKKNIMLSMGIAGALAGLAACFFYLNPDIEFKPSAQYSALPDYGFNGIASAFLANCNPAGTIFSSIFIRYLNMGGEVINKYGFNRYVADIIIAIIIYVAAFSKIIRDVLSKKKKRDNSARDSIGIPKPIPDQPEVVETKIEETDEPIELVKEIVVEGGEK